MFLRGFYINSTSFYMKLLFFEFRNSPVGQNVKGKVQVFDRRRFLEAVFDMFSGHADVEVRKNYGRVSE